MHSCLLLWKHPALPDRRPALAARGEGRHRNQTRKRFFQQALHHAPTQCKSMKNHGKTRPVGA
jgi:hypothetical protein